MQQAIEQHLSTVTASDLADLVGFSPSHLGRLLRRLTGLSLEQLIRRQRMHRAAQLLADTDQSILEIVAAVGYQSVGAFYAAFEQHHGLAPGAYREQLTGTRLG